MKYFTSRFVSVIFFDGEKNLIEDFYLLSCWCWGKWQFLQPFPTTAVHRPKLGSGEGKTGILSNAPSSSVTSSSHFSPCYPSETFPTSSFHCSVVDVVALALFLRAEWVKRASSRFSSSCLCPHRFNGPLPWTHGGEGCRYYYFFILSLYFIVIFFFLGVIEESKMCKIASQFGHP